MYKEELDSNDWGSQMFDDTFPQGRGSTVTRNHIDKRRHSKNQNRILILKKMRKT